MKRKTGIWPPPQPCCKCGFVHVLAWPCPKEGDRWRTAMEERND